MPSNFRHLANFWVTKNLDLKFRPYIADIRNGKAHCPRTCERSM